MSRTNNRKLSLSLENLEGRNLQSGLSAAANGAIIAIVTPSPMIAPASQQFQANIVGHAYHGVTGFFGQ